MPCPVTDDVSRAADVLRQGGLVAFPTETVYGLGANALDGHAVARIFDAKARPHFDPLIVHVAELSWLDRLVVAFPEKANRLAEKFWPGPMTLVLPKSEVVPDLVTSGLPTCGLRIPDHPLAIELLRKTGLPIAAPSANSFGQLSPTRAEHVSKQLGDRIDLILDGGPCRVGVESTVVQILDEDVRVLRPGGIAVEQLQEVVGTVSLASGSLKTDVLSAQESPGMLSQHYAPRTPLVVMDDLEAVRAASRIGLFSFRPVETRIRFAAVEILSPEGDLVEAAANFFAALHRLDAYGLDAIIATSFPGYGLGRALNDRLRRASSPFDAGTLE